MASGAAAIQAAARAWADFAKSLRAGPPPYAIFEIFKVKKAGPPPFGRAAMRDPCAVPLHADERAKPVRRVCKEAVSEGLRDPGSRLKGG